MFEDPTQVYGLTARAEILEVRAARMRNEKRSRIYCLPNLPIAVHVSEITCHALPCPAVAHGSAWKGHTTTSITCANER